MIVIDSKNKKYNFYDVYSSVIYYFIYIEIMRYIFYQKYIVILKKYYIMVYPFRGTPWVMPRNFQKS